MVATPLRGAAAGGGGGGGGGGWVYGGPGGGAGRGRVVARRGVRDGGLQFQLLPVEGPGVELVAALSLRPGEGPLPGGGRVRGEGPPRPPHAPAVAAVEEVHGGDGAVRVRGGGLEEEGGGVPPVGGHWQESRYRRWVLRDPKSILDLAVRRVPVGDVNPALAIHPDSAEPPHIPSRVVDGLDGPSSKCPSGVEEIPGIRAPVTDMGLVSP